MHPGLGSDTCSRRSCGGGARAVCFLPGRDSVGARPSSLAVSGGPVGLQTCRLDHSACKSTVRRTRGGTSKIGPCEWAVRRIASWPFLCRAFLSSLSSGFVALYHSITTQFLLCGFCRGFCLFQSISRSVPTIGYGREVFFCEIIEHLIFVNWKI